jgi:hypothetical protein
MSLTFSLADSLAVADLRVYLERAGRIEDASARFVADSGVLAVYTGILYPRGLLDTTPTVLGLRTFATDPDAALDAVVPIRTMLDRLARLPQAFDDDGPVGIRLPPETGTASWAGISPPRGGWQRVGEAGFDALETAARAGIEEIAAAIPPGTGEHIVQRVRSEVWRRPVAGLDAAVDDLPAGAAFAGSSLGFLHPDETAALLETGPWLRLSTRRGHVLVRRSRR